MAGRYPPGPNDRLLGMRTMAGMKSDVLGAYTRLHDEYGDSVSFRTGPYRLFVFFHPDQVLPRFDVTTVPNAAEPVPQVHVALRPRAPLMIRWSRRDISERTLRRGRVARSETLVDLSG